MQKLKTKLRQLKYKFKYDFFTFDNIVLSSAIIACFIWTWGSVSSIARNWELAQIVAERQRELSLMQLESDTLELENEYYQSSEYQELSARRLANKKMSGENMIYLPENTEEAKSKHLGVEVMTASIMTEEKSNFEQWITFLFGDS